MARPSTPVLATDVVIELVNRPGQPIVLIRRRNAPLGWALPGGFVDVGETVEDAARREMLEETGLAVRLKALLGVYSTPDRDPRGHCVSATYVAEAVGEPAAGDDAGDILICAPDGLPAELAFDHARILADYRTFRATGQLPGPAPRRPA